MKMMPEAMPARTRVLILLLLALCWITKAPAIGSESADDTWADYQFLLGSWAGAIDGALGTGAGERSYELIIGDRYLLSRHTSHRPPQEKSPEGDAHEEWGIFSYDRTRSVVVYRQFLIEGFVNRYTCQTRREPQGFVCETEEVESGPGMRARWEVMRTGADSFEETFALAAPDKELQILFTNRWTRRDQ